MCGFDAWCPVDPLDHHTLKRALYSIFVLQILLYWKSTDKLLFMHGENRTAFSTYLQGAFVALAIIHGAITQLCSLQDGWNQDSCGNAFFSSVKKK
jgi:hypothetical protein